MMVYSSVRVRHDCCVQNRYSLIWAGLWRIFPQDVQGLTTADGGRFRAATGAPPDSATADSAGELGQRLQKKR
jgi:hypothetical protein